MKKITVCLILSVSLIAALAACGENKPVKPGVLVIVNNTGEDVREMNVILSSGEGDWSEKDYLGGKVLKNGESIEIATSAFAGEENYDLTFTGASDKDYFKWDINPKQAGAVIINASDFEKLD